MKGLKPLKGLVIGVFALCSTHLWASESASYRLITTWSASNNKRDLKSWSFSDLLKLKKFNSREKDPLTGKVIKWDGILLSHLLDKVSDGLTVEERAQVDLIILKGKNGQQARVPRALISKYPLFIAYQWSTGEKADKRGSIYSVVPWTSKPKILNEGLPLENFFIPQVERIELANYRDQYSSLFLKRRTDPVAMRGEKLFVQNCYQCHSAGRAPGFTAFFEQQKLVKFIGGHHPNNTQWVEYLTERDRKSIARYLDAHKNENPEVHNSMAGNQSAFGNTVTKVN